MIYRCDVTGNPIPSITWMAEDERNGRTITLTADLNGINIESGIAEFDDEESSGSTISQVFSELTISESSPFLMPSCHARNEIGRDQEDEFIGNFCSPSLYHTALYMKAC